MGGRIPLLKFYDVARLEISIILADFKSLFAALDSVEKFSPCFQKM
jgi:hypothetical protein